jgi:hypothetical protein
VIQTSLLGENLGLSGGAPGADLAWGRAAEAAGHWVLHWSFDGHRTQAPADRVARLTADHLAAANPLLKRANKALGRRWPVRDADTANLLRRNYYQVRWSDSVYAVSHFENGQVAGGTAWAVQMYLDRWIHDGANLDRCRCFVFDQKEGCWYRWYTGWERIEIPPRPEGIYAAVGSRDLLPAGSDAIVNIYTAA